MRVILYWSPVGLDAVEVVGRHPSSRKLVSRSPPHAANCRSQHTHHDPRTLRRRWIHIPRPLLRGPERILHHRMEPCFPQKKRSSPGNVRIELVVQRPGAEHAYGDGGENRGHNERGGYAESDGVLVPGAVSSKQVAKKSAGVALRGFDPAGASEMEEEGCVSS